jgi:HKD family nuclease
MAKKEFIFQGFTAQTHGDAVRRLFNVPDIERVTVSVAFVTDGGVELVQGKLKTNAAKLTVFAGVRNNVTSHQALARLLKIGGTLYVVDTGARGLLFHPKLFLVRGKARAALVMGSANLTSGGLNNNIEAGMFLDFDLADGADKAVVDKIEAQLSVLPKDYPDNVLKIGSVADLDKMLAGGRLVDEMTPAPPRVTRPSGGAGTSDSVPRMKLKVKLFVGSATLARRAGKKAAAPKVATSSKTPTSLSVAATLGVPLEVVWESKPLSRRSLTIPAGAGSNPTGSSTLGKGMYDDIDPVTYFRKDVFGHLPWSSYTNQAGNKAEKVDAEFDLVIKGALVGTFLLTLRHSLTRAKAAAKDKNSPTEISWNAAKSFIQRKDLLDRTMRLYRAPTNPMKFRIDID